MFPKHEMTTSPGITASATQRSWVGHHHRALQPKSPAACHSAAPQSFTLHPQQADPHLAVEQGKPHGSPGFESGSGHASTPLTLWGFSRALRVPPGKISPCVGIQTSTLEAAGTSASEAVGWFHLDNAGTRTDSYTLQARALYLARSACRRATPLHTPSKPSLSSPPQLSSLTLPLQMAEQGELCSRAGIPITSSPSSILSLQFPVCREMPVTGGRLSWVRFHAIFNSILLVLLHTLKRDHTKRKATL